MPCIFCLEVAIVDIRLVIYYSQSITITFENIQPITITFENFKSITITIILASITFCYILLQFDANSRNFNRNKTDWILYTSNFIENASNYAIQG